MSFQGIELTPEMRKLVVNVKEFFDKCKKNSDLFDRPTSVLTASALGISESTVKVIMSAFNKTGENGLLKSNNEHRGRPSFSLESNLESDVRKFIRDTNKQGQQVTIDIISKKLSEIDNNILAKIKNWLGNYYYPAVYVFWCIVILFALLMIFKFAFMFITPSGSVDGESSSGGRSIFGVIILATSLLGIINKR